jgi:signal transduction histidine kinase
VPDDASLRTIPLFASLDARMLRTISEASRRRTVDAGAIVFAEGDQPDGMYVVVTGRVRVFRQDDAGNEIELTTRDQGEIFGELALLEGAVRSASVAAIEPSEFLVLDRTTFLTLLAGPDSAVAAMLLSSLSRMIRERTDRLWRDELARRELQARVEIERHRALAQMVAGVAHELNTPLAIANTAADLMAGRLSDAHLQERLADDRQAEVAVEDIIEASVLLRRNLERAHRLIQSFKQISVQQLSDVIETVDLAELTRDVVGLFAIEARRAGLIVVIDDRLPADRRAWVGYPGSYTQVLMNLLRNVERYAYPARDGGAIEISLEERQGARGPGFAVAVVDHGVGIDEAHLAHAFEPFYTTGRSTGGTGLGLAIVHNLVTSALGGTIEIMPTPGGGVAVGLWIPSHVPEPAAAPDAQIRGLSTDQVHEPALP